MTEILTSLGKAFVTQPYIALIPALFFAFLYFQFRNKVILSTSALWIVYAAYEALHYVRILCSGECNIRIDLVLIYPVLILLSIISLFLAAQSFFKK